VLLSENVVRQNILSREFRDVGIAVLIDRVNERVWLTEDLGAPARA
jgi:hypothetical protein